MSGFMRKIKMLLKQIEIAGKQTQDSMNSSEAANSLYKNKILKHFTLKKLVIFGLTSNALALSYLVTTQNRDRYNLSISRYVSRKVGKVMDVTVPTFMRNFVYSGYMKFYNVNQEEILEPELKSYRSLSEFFIRKIKMELRPVKEKNPNILVSPSDSKVFSISKVNNISSLMLVKNIKYNLAEFLFGPKPYAQLVYDLDSLLATKDVYQITLYLSPGDCHRYFAATDMHVSNRIYIPGFLLPVKPSYINKHPYTYNVNERVTIKGSINDSDNTVYTTFVGALNVGSMCLNFDDFLQTNQKINDADLKDNDGAYILNYNELSKNTKLERPKTFYFKPSVPLLLQEIKNELDEFEIRDMINVDLVPDIPTVPKEASLSIFLERLESSLKYKYENNFLGQDKLTFSLNQKFENPKKMKIDSFENIEGKGISLKRLDELGWFNFGSSIVLIFSVKKNQKIKFNFKVGDKVKIGETLYTLED